MQRAAFHGVNLRLDRLQKFKTIPVRHRMFTRSRNLMLAIRCANFVFASFVVLCFIIPENWGRGAWAGPRVHVQFTVRLAFLTTLAYAWFISAIFWFIRSSFEWLCCLVCVFAFIVFFAVALFGFMNSMPDHSPEPSAGCHSRIFHFENNL